MDKRHFNYTVYIHINQINGKQYVGITSLRPIDRWGKNGEKYKRSPHFYSAIQKYGWDSFSHIIVKDNLPEQCAKTLEKVLIALLDTTNNKKGYNITIGGEGNCGRKYGDEEKERRAKSHFKAIEQWSDDELINTYDSIKDAAISLNICGSSITEAAKGKRKTAGGYIWKYKEK